MLDETLLTELEIVAQRGAENASSSLSTFLGRSVVVTVNGVEMAHIEAIPESMGRGEILCVGLLSRVKGEVEGNSLLLFDREDALHLVRMLGSRETGVEIEGFGALERSMLEETANITISSFMNSIASHLDRRCVPNAPVYLLDMAGAILSVILMESAAVADSVILFSTRFSCQDANMQALFVFLPNPESLNVIEEALPGDA